MVSFLAPECTRNCRNCSRLNFSPSRSCLPRVIPQAVYMGSSTLQWLSVSQTLCKSRGRGVGGLLEGADQEAPGMGCDQGSLSLVPGLDSSISRTSVTIPHPPPHPDVRLPPGGLFRSPHRHFGSGLQSSQCFGFMKSSRRTNSPSQHK